MLLQLVDSSNIEQSQNLALCFGCVTCVPVYLILQHCPGIQLDCINGGKAQA